jgi:hypothetical protein
LIPYAGIIFDLNVSFFEEASKPGILGAIDRRRFVIEAEISENLRAGRVSGANLRVTVKNSVGLVEIDGLGDVRGNNFVVFAALGDAIHLDREEYGDTVAL